MRSSRAYLRLLHWAHLARRPLTLGVRIAAFDPAGRILLVRHTYLKGWYLPGGGVEPGETSLEAAERELREEAEVIAPGGLALVSIHLNRHASRRDHVLVYRADAVRQIRPKRKDREIAEAAFFAFDALPEGTSAASRRRLSELLEGAAPDPYW